MLRYILVVGSLAPAGVRAQEEGVDLGLPFIAGEPLSEAIQQRVYDLNVAVAKLGDSADPKITAMLIAALADKSRFVRHKATEHLAQCHDPVKAVPALQGVLEQAASDFDTQILPTLYLHRVGGKWAYVPNDRIHMNNPLVDHAVPCMRVAMRSLAAQGGHAAEAVLIDFIGGRNVGETPPSVYREAAELLCAMGSRKGLEAVLGFREQLEKWVRMPEEKRVTKVRGIGLRRDEFGLTEEADLRKIDAELRRAFIAAGLRTLPAPRGKRTYVSAKTWRRLIPRVKEKLASEPRPVEPGSRR